MRDAQILADRRRIADDDDAAAGRRRRGSTWMIDGPPSAARRSRAGAGAAAARRRRRLATCAASRLGVGTATAAGVRNGLSRSAMAPERATTSTTRRDATADASGRRRTQPRRAAAPARPASGRAAGRSPCRIGSQAASLQPRVPEIKLPEPCGPGSDRIATDQAAGPCAGRCGRLLVAARPCPDWAGRPDRSSRRAAGRAHS